MEVRPWCGKLVTNSGAGQMVVPFDLLSVVEDLRAFGIIFVGIASGLLRVQASNKSLPYSLDITGVREVNILQEDRTLLKRYGVVGLG